MARKYKEYKAKEKKPAIKNDELVFLPHNQEKRVEYINEEKESRRDYRRKQIKAKYKDSDWVLIEDEEAIAKIWGAAGRVMMDRIHKGDILCYLWKYSGLNVYNESKEDEKYIKALKKEDIEKIEDQVTLRNYYNHNLIVNDFGQIELTKKGKKNERNEDGSAKWTRVKGSKTQFVKGLRLTINNLPVSIMKYILKK